MSNVLYVPLFGMAAVATLLVGCGSSKAPPASTQTASSPTITFHVKEMGERLQLM